VPLNGRMKVPETPGFGVRLNPECALVRPYSHWRGAGARTGGGRGLWTPSDALALLWNLLWYWFISFAPVRGGSHFLCCCKESNQRKQLWAQRC